MGGSLHRLKDTTSSPERSFPETNSGSVPATFDFQKFFLGHTRASGWFADRFGKPRRHFHGAFFGHFSDDAFLLDETLIFSDGIVENRQWSVKVSSDGLFTAESASLVNGARGRVNGNTLTMSYAMKVEIEEGKFWDLSMKDQMILQPDGSLHNITQVYKWGIRLGSVSAQYQRSAGDRRHTQTSADANESELSRQVRVFPDVSHG